MLKRIGAEESGEFKAVARGTLPCGKPVVVNADGTVSVVSTTTLTEAKGSNVEFESGVANNQGVAYDSNSDRVVITYKDENNSNYGTAIVGTVSGDSISFGTAVVFESAQVSHTTPVFDSSNNKIVVAYQDQGNSGAGTAIVGTVDPSDNSISFGSATAFESGNTNNSIGISFDTSASKVVIAFRDNGDSNYGKAIVGTVSGTSISFGTVATFNSATTTYVSIAYDIANNKHVIGYVATSGNAKVATVSGTSISFGSAVEFESGATILTKVLNDPNINRVHIFYADGGDNDKGKAVIGSVSGTGISFTSPSNFYTAAQVTQIGVSFNSSINAITVATRDNGGALNMYTTTATTSAYTFGSAFAIDASITTGNVNHAHVSTADRTVLAFTDGGDSSKGKAVVYTGAGDVKNLTSENYIGMSRGVVAQGTSTQAVGSAAVFESANANNIGSAYDSTNNKVVVAYRDNGDSAKGKAVVGTVDTSNNSISFGTPVQFEAGDTEFVNAVFDANSGKIVISFKDNGDTYGKAIVGTVSGTSISFGSAVTFKSANMLEIGQSVYDSTNNKVVIIYASLVSPYDGKAVVGTVSGTSISFGSEVSFSGSNSAQNIFSSFDSTLGKVVVAYTQSNNSGYAVVGTVSGTSISFGTPVNFNGGTNNAIRISCAYDSTANRTVIFYRDQSNSSYDTAIVGTVSGTTISFGTKAVVTSQSNNSRAITHDANAGTNVLAVSTNYNFKVGTVDASDNSITFSSATAFDGANANDVSALFDSTGKKVVLSYQDTGNSNYGTSTVVSLAAPIIIRAEVASGQAASIDIIGSVSTNQSSLTAGQQYFVQNDGTIGTTAATPSVLAGTAISATELVVKT